MAWLVRRLVAGFRRRRGTAVLIAATAAVVAVVASTTPILTRAVQQAALDRILSAEAPLDRAVLGNATSNDEVDPVEAADRAGRVTAALRTPGVWAAGRVYREQNDTPLGWAEPTVQGGQPKQRIADLPVCRDLRFTSGGCPSGVGEAAVAQSTFARTGLRLGQQVVLKSFVHRITVRIVGVYDAATPAGRLQAHPSSTVSAPTTGLDPDLLLAPNAFTAAQLPTTAFSVRSLREHVPLSALPGIRRDLARADAVPLATASAQASTHALVSTVGAILDRAAAQTGVVAVVLQVVAAGAFALAVIALGALALRLGRVRAAEWALPRLRGMPRRRRFAARLGESLLPLLAGALLGTAAAVLTAVAVTDGATRASVLVVVPAAIGFAATATVIGAAAFVAVGIAADRRPLDEQLRQTADPRELSRPALVGSAVIVVGAVAAVIALLTSSGSAVDGAGLLAPVLIALAAGLIGLQVALLVARRRTRRVPASLAALVVWRRLGRAPSQATAGVLVAGAVALGTFVSLTSVTADALADATAQAAVAGQTVLTVRTPQRLSLLDAVDRADPGGSRAMAAEESRLGDGTSSVVAVDASRLAAVSTWRSAWSGEDAAALVERLAPPVHPSVGLRGTRLRLRIDDVAPGSSSFGAESFALAVTLQTPSGLDAVELGTFAPSGSHAFTATIPCDAGCSFVSLAVRCADQYPPPWSLHLRITSMSTDGLPAGALAPVLQRGAWTTENGNVLDASLPVTSRAAPSAAGLVLDMTDAEGSGRPAVRIRDTVEPLPAVLGPTTVAEPFPGSSAAVIGSGTDGTALLLRPVGRASALPRLLGDGVLVDLRRMLPQIDRSSTEPEQQVWIRGDAAPIERALRRQGVRVLETETLAAASATARGEAGPLSARSALLGAGGALVVVLLTLLGSRLIGAPRRRRQWDAFANGGVARRDLRRLAAVEFSAPAVAGIAVGTLSGAAAFLLAIPRLPLADAPPDAPPAGVVPPWGLGLVVPVAALVAVLLMTALVAHVETRDRPTGGTR